MTISEASLEFISKEKITFSDFDKCLFITFSILLYKKSILIDSVIFDIDTANSVIKIEYQETRKSCLLDLSPTTMKKLFAFIVRTLKSDKPLFLILYSKVKEKNYKECISLINGNETTILLSENQFPSSNSYDPYENFSWGGLSGEEAYIGYCNTH